MINNHIQDERKWMQKLPRQLLLCSNEHVACTLILGAVEDTWVRRLKNVTTYYSKVPPIYITDHLAENIRGLENINVMALQQAMTNWCKEDPRVPNYFNRL